MCIRDRIGLDEGDHFVHLVGIHLCGGDLGSGFGGQLCSQLVALGLGTAGDADLGEHLGYLTACLLYTSRCV